VRGRIPAELRKLAQWVCCRPDKIPLDPRTGQRASVTDHATWGTFDQALASQLWTGFVLNSDPYTVIDLDDKGTLTREQQDVHARILSAFSDTYVERSINGRGFHIWCRGKLPEAIKRDSVEIYTQDRYMVCTGDVANDKPIVDKQSLLEQLAGEMKPRPTSAFTDQNASLSDDDIWRMASTAANASKFISLCEGTWHAMGYPSQS
jgi:primase-polymerase (primpol)-like protein